MNKVIFLMFLLLSISVSLFARSSVWKVSDGNKTLYIGGTIHLLRPNDFPLPAEFDKAYKQSAFLVFETDMEAFNKPENSVALISKSLLPQGRTLSSMLNNDTNEKLKRYLLREKLNFAMFDRLQPWMAVMMLTQAQLGKMGMAEKGVDSYYTQMARNDGKKSHFLETPQEQIEIISKMGEGEEDVIINQTLDDLEKLSELINGMMLGWRNGDTFQLEHDLLSPMKSSAPQFYHRLVKKRNDEWMKMLMKMISEKQKGFVLVGALHLVGNDGLLKQFERRGYRVEPVE